MRSWWWSTVVVLLVASLPAGRALAVDTDTDTSDTSDSADSGSSGSSGSGGSSSSSDSDLRDCGDSDTDFTACYPSSDQSQTRASEAAGDTGGCTCAGDQSDGSVVLVGLLALAVGRRRREG